jgi:hypothetical protein
MPKSFGQFEGHYVDWQEKRRQLLFRELDKFSARTRTPFSVLEVGAGNGFFGAQIATRYPRATVFITDARAEHIEAIEIKAANTNKFVLDAREVDRYPKVDIILHFGLLYHLDDPIAHLKILRAKTWKLLLLETEVVNLEGKTVLYLEEQGYDQSVSLIGGRPSSKAVEAVFSNWLKFNVKRFDETTLNSGFHTYDWLPQSTKISWRHGLRRIWAISRKY